MRIISGKWGGRKLVSFESDEIRPTTDMVKETIFNMIGPDIVGAKVLDLFTGTGSLCFESLSRGADFVMAVDMGGDSQKIFEKNKELLGVEDSDFTFKSQDVLSFLSESTEKFDYILIDPPFTKRMAAEVIRALADSAVLNENTRVFIECVKGEDTIENCGILKTKKVKKYGDKSLHTYCVESLEG